MAEVLWSPPEARPADAADLERRMNEAVPLCRVKATWSGSEWRVRALAPAAGCGRGRSFDDRDVSETIAEVLRDAGHAASS